MTFDPTITFGAILNAGAILIGFVVAFTRIGGRIDLLAQRMEAVEKKIDATSDAEKRITILEERISNHVKMLTVAQQDIADLRRGKGFIASNRQSVDGEY